MPVAKRTISTILEKLLSEKRLFRKTPTCTPSPTNGSSTIASTMISKGNRPSWKYAGIFARLMKKYSNVVVATNVRLPNLCGSRYMTMTGPAMCASVEKMPAMMPNTTPCHTLNCIAGAISVVAVLNRCVKRPRTNSNTAKRQAMPPMVFFRCTSEMSFRMKLAIVIPMIAPGTIRHILGRCHCFQ